MAAVSKSRTLGDRISIHTQKAEGRDRRREKTRSGTDYRLLKPAPSDTSSSKTLPLKGSITSINTNNN